jgi:hypothetical protein
MNIQEQITADIKEAMKSKESDKLRVLRSLKAKLLEKEVSIRQGGEAKLSDDQIVEVLMKAAKQRKESIEQFKSGGRDDLAAAEEAELSIIKSYLPEMMGEDEIREKVKAKINQLGASSMAEMGKVMGALMGELKGKADGSVISRIVREELS